MADIMLETKNIIKKFPGVIANSNVNLKINKGEIHGLIGENGAGKSTLLKIITGEYTHGTYEGEILIESKPVVINSTKDAYNMGIRYVPQEINVLNERTVAENIFAPTITTEAKLGMINSASIVNKAVKLLDENGLLLDPRQIAKKLSIGQKQMLMIARALTGDTKVIILDEPTTSLSEREVKVLFKIVRRLKEKGLGIVFVTHKLTEILELTDRVTILRDGSNVASYGADDYTADKIISDMIGRSVTNMYPGRKVVIGREVLRVENVSVDHPFIQDRNLLEKISFNLNKGEVLGIAGLVGAGRTELMQTLFGKYKCKTGYIYIDERKVKIANERIALKNGIVLVTEDRKKDGLLFGTDIKWNATANKLKKLSRFGFLNGRKIKTEAEEIINKLSIKAPGIKSNVIDLSGGNQQKVVIGRAVNINPKILLLDEPTKGIDVGSKNEIYNLINQLVADGMSIIMVSSELPELLAMCDRFLVMANGRITGELTKEEATEKKIMAYAI